MSTALSNPSSVQSVTTDSGSRVTPRVNLAACGVFHYRHYVRHLQAEGVLQRFYYSHRRSTDAAALGLASDVACNFPAKEYLTQLHLRTLHHRLADRLFPRYQSLWERQVLRNWVDCDLLHVLLHGAERRLVPHARRSGAVVVGEPVNAHPEVVQALLREEHDRLGIPDHAVRTLNNGQRATLEAAAECDVLLAPSRFVADSYIAQGTPAEKFLVEPYGTDLSRFQPGPRPADGVFRVLCVSQISVRKGHIDLLRAWELLNLSNAELVFVGAMTPEMRPVLEPLGHLFVYRGIVPHHQLATEFHRADVVVQPSIEDGFAVVPLEAMACGKPVIVSRNVGASEVVSPGETGFVVPVRSPAAIAEALQALHHDVPLREHMALTAARRAQAGFSWEGYAGRLAALYRERLSHPARTRPRPSTKVVG